MARALPTIGSLIGGEGTRATRSERGVTAFRPRLRPIPTRRNEKYISVPARAEEHKGIGTLPMKQALPTTGRVSERPGSKRKNVGVMTPKRFNYSQ